LETANKFLKRDSLKQIRNENEINWTWAEYLRDTFRFGKALIHLGVNERAAVNIMGSNAPEWSISFMGSIFANCIATGVYITNTPEALLY